MFHRTQRLFLRPAFPEDAAAIHAAIARKEIVCNLASAPWPYTQDDAKTFAGAAQDKRLPHFVLTLPGTGLIGGAGLGLDSRNDPSLGYWIAAEFQGRGYATEAVLGLMEVARTLGHRRLVAEHFSDNPASGRVLIKAGFQPTGEVRPSFSRARAGAHPSVCYAVALTDCRAPGNCLPRAA
ncbi:GNAT family N-acetyltransferase [Porphyrobacter sp. GA68]|uniref:GNAT family N-acetyltransferase n=1 Tax=Porphyrobacter sp. GA68 TaxID=2883480 RepID=UPI001D182F82|nr:GNAT family N-acetyltransferase [Porphyrobacter sp. GA68]